MIQAACQTIVANQNEAWNEAYYCKIKSSNHHALTIRYGSVYQTHFDLKFPSFGGRYQDLFGGAY